MVQEVGEGVHILLHDGGVHALLHGELLLCMVLRLLVGLNSLGQDVQVHLNSNIPQPRSRQPIIIFKRAFNILSIAPYFFYHDT